MKKTKKIALISAYDRQGLVEFVKQVAECGYDIVSTGGTAAELRANGIEVIEVSELTGRQRYWMVASKPSTRTSTAGYWHSATMRITNGSWSV